MTEIKKGRGGAGRGQGRKPKPKLPELPGGKEKFQEIIDGLNREERPDDAQELKAFRAIERSGADASLTLRKWLYEQRHGKPVHTVNHLHDKPIEMNVNVTLSAAIQKARKRAHNH